MSARAPRRDVQPGDVIDGLPGTASSYRVLSLWLNYKGDQLGIATSEKGRRRPFTLEGLVLVEAGPIAGVFGEGARRWRVERP